MDSDHAQSGPGLTPSSKSNDRKDRDACGPKDPRATRPTLDPDLMTYRATDGNTLDTNPT